MPEDEAEESADRDAKDAADDAPAIDPGRVRQVILDYKKEAEVAKRTRMQKNKENVDAYLGRQDWSHKQKGQSCEFLPKTPTSVEQFCAFFKRALIMHGDWFSVDVAPDYPLSAQDVRDLLQVYLARLPFGQGWTSFPIILTDGVKQGLLESLLIFKVHGRTVPKREFYAERGTRLQQMTGPEGPIPYPVPDVRLKQREGREWRLCIDLVEPEAYFPDPTGRNLYEIHTVERDFSEVVELAEAGIYDEDAVLALDQDFRAKEAEADRAAKANQDLTTAPSFRRLVRIDEFWGTLLNEDGTTLMRNCVAALANDVHLIRPPEPNPWWHQESPFVRAPLLRVPRSVWHKAVYDHAVELNKAENELFNLMLDGGLASVWGVKQVRTDLLEDPRQITGGIPQGLSVAVKAETPPGVKVIEQVATGAVPPDAFNMFMAVDRHFDGAAYTNDLKMGLFPPKQVKACVPMHSQALTRHGWRRPEELTVGEEILAYNLESKRCEWTPLLDVLVYEQAETVRYRSRSFSVVCTDDHKWVRRPKPDSRAPGGAQWRLLPIDAEGRQGQILQAAPAPDGKGLGRLAVETLLCREDLPALVLEMTSAERQAFLIGVLAGEGTRNAGSSGAASISMTQNPGPTLEAFRLACALEGIATHEYQATQRPGYTAKRVSLLLRPRQGIAKLRKTQDLTQRVWCPSTRFHTWIMRQGETITITGNTEVVEASQSQAVTLDAIAADLETDCIAPLLRKAYLCLLQNADDLSTREVQRAVGPKNALMLASLPAAERFARLANGADFRVYGLSTTLARTRDFQKLMALLQVVTTSPLLLQSFAKRFSPDKMIGALMTYLNLNPEHLELTDEERSALPQMLASLPQWAQITGGMRGAGNQGGEPGAGGPEPGIPAEVNQVSNPLSGMGGF